MMGIGINLRNPNLFRKGERAVAVLRGKEGR